MKTNKTKMLLLLLFVAVSFFSAFILIEFHFDYIAVSLAGVAMLICAYFLVDKIESDICKRYEAQQAELEQKFDIGYKKMQRIEDAILNSSMQGRVQPEQKFQELLEKLEHISISAEQENLMVILKNSFQTMIKYSKENARQVALNTNDNTQRLMEQIESQIEALKKETPTLSNPQINEIQNKFESVSEAYLENASLISQRLEEIESSMDEIIKYLKGDSVKVS